MNETLDYIKYPTLCKLTDEELHLPDEIFLDDESDFDIAILKEKLQKPVMRSLIDGILERDAKAENQLGDCYRYGFCMQSEYGFPGNWYGQDEDFPLQITGIENYPYFGRDGVPDSKEAVKWYFRSAKQGYAIAQCNLGNCYYCGDGVEQNYEKSVEWYQKAAEQNYIPAYYLLSCCYEYGKGVEKNPTLSEEYLRKAARLGYPSAQYKLGRFYDKKHNDEEAVKWYQKAAEQSLVDAQTTLASCYQHGRGGETDYREAVKWYVKAAEQGALSAAKEAADIYFNGKGFGKNEVKKDYEEAVKWYAKIPLHDIDEYRYEEVIGNIFVCCYTLGNNYYRGCEVERNFEKAVEWLQKISDESYYNTVINEYVWRCRMDRGRKKTEDDFKSFQRKLKYYRDCSQAMLGDCYYHGTGVEQDYQKAFEYYIKLVSKPTSHIDSFYSENKKYADWELSDIDPFNVFYEYEKWKQNTGNKDYYDNFLGAEHSNVFKEIDRQYCEELRDKYRNLLYQLGCCCEKLGDYPQAVTFHEQAMKEEHPKAAFHLGLCYENGFGVQKDYQKALKYYQKAAVQEVLPAVIKLGDYYFAQSKYDEAIKYYLKSPELVDAHICRHLGDMYYEGIGVEQDYIAAVRWYQISRRKGDEEVLHSLGMSYLRVYEERKASLSDVERPLKLAAQYLKEAAEKGNEAAKKDYNALFTVFGSNRRILKEYGFTKMK